uniref:Uncharacterized protein n=1 Tax=Opuntia streptacantha TaxID=393608 RepID=A0A7C9E8I9_OPUST
MLDMVFIIWNAGRNAPGPRFLQLPYFSQSPQCTCDKLRPTKSQRRHEYTMITRHRVVHVKMALERHLIKRRKRMRRNSNRNLSGHWKHCAIGLSTTVDKKVENQLHILHYAVVVFSAILERKIHAL